MSSFKFGRTDEHERTNQLSNKSITEINKWAP